MNSRSADTWQGSGGSAGTQCCQCTAGWSHGDGLVSRSEWVRRLGASMAGNGSQKSIMDGSLQTGVIQNKGGPGARFW